MPKKVTMQYIANYLGVSKYVVSRALSGKNGVSKATKSKVLQAASNLGYFEQKPAAFKQTIGQADLGANKEEKQSVLVLMPNVRLQTRTSTYWGRILKGLTNRLEELGYGTVILTNPNVNQFSNVLNPNGFLGVIGIGLIQTSYLMEIYRMNLPVVLVDHEDPLYVCDTVFNNNFDGVARLTRHMMGLGHKRMAFVGNINYARSFYDRWLGFRSVMEENQLNMNGEGYLPSKNVNTQDLFDYERWLNWLSDKKKRGTMPTAFVCANDAVAISLIAILRELKLSVPQDVSVLGFDNNKESYETTPTLTTIHANQEELGSKAVETLLRRARDPNLPYEKILLNGKLVLRESTDYAANQSKHVVKAE